MTPERCFTLVLPLSKNGFSIVNVNILPGSMCSHFIDLNYTPGSINKSNLFCADGAYFLKRVKTAYVHEKSFKCDMCDEIFNKVQQF